MTKEYLKLSEIPQRLLAWYDQNARVLPWRENPEPYRVWVSEIMLQQTRVEAVKPYYERFLNQLPTIADLAAVEEERLMKLWEGLGYYNRVRNLQKAAQIILQKHGGEVPRSYEEITALPGIGAYTAGAILSIAYQLPYPAVDGNVLRVLTRVLGSYENISENKVKSSFGSALQEVLPARVGDFNQSLMELGATVCLPNGAPLCLVCPLADICTACAEGLQGELPVKTAKKERKIETRYVFFLMREGRVALRRRPEQGLLAGMWEFPNETEPEIPQEWNLTYQELQSFGAAKHIFTHVEWHMEGILIHVSCSKLPEGWVWADEKKLEEVYALPFAFKAYQKKIKSYFKKA